MSDYMIDEVNRALAKEASQEPMSADDRYWLMVYLEQCRREREARLAGLSPYRIGRTGRVRSQAAVS